MFGRKGKYSTLEGDSHGLVNVGTDGSKDDYSSQKGNRKVTALVVTVLCVIVLAVVILVPILVVNEVHHKNDNDQGLQCPEAVGERVDCYPERDGNASEDTCHSRGCCWADSGISGAPCCFFPNNYGYNVKNVSETKVGENVAIQKYHSNLPYPNEIMELVLEAYYEKDYRLRVKVSV